MTFTRDSLLLALAWLLGVGAAIGFTVAAWEAWATHSDGDMLERCVEYAWFREGTYPNQEIESQGQDRPRRNTVYPPYALPMFAVFFEPGGMIQGRLVLQGLSLASIVAMGWYGRRTLAPYGSAVGSLGVVLGAAVADNATAIRVGQFSIICVGLIVLQMVCLSRDRPVAAGIFWALAMLKPHLALPFVALFLLRRQVLGLIVGGLTLVLLSGFACWWTEVSPMLLIEHWVGGLSLKFIEDGYDIGPAAIAKRTGIDHRAILAGVAACATAVIIALTAASRALGTAAILPMAAAISVVGMFSCYHRHYDNIMLFPALLATTHVAARTRRPVDIVIAASLLISLAIPLWILNAAPLLHIGVVIAWIVGGFLPITSLVASRRHVAFEAPTLAASVKRPSCGGNEP